MKGFKEREGNRVLGIERRMDGWMDYGEREWGGFNGEHEWPKIEEVYERIYFGPCRRERMFCMGHIITLVMV